MPLVPYSTPNGPNLISSYNSPPHFPAYAPLILQPGQSTGFITFRATDPEGQIILTTGYTFDSPPPGAQYNISGQFRWIVPTNQPPGDYSFTVRVTDSGVPPRSGAAIITVIVVAPGTVTTVTPPPVIESVFHVAGQATFTIETTPGRTYRVLYSDDLNSSTWIQIGRDFVAANPYASFTDGSAALRRFYRVQQLD
jgi:hypothetical protein